MSYYNSQQVNQCHAITHLVGTGLSEAKSSDECDGDQDYIVDLNCENEKLRNALHIAIQNGCPADIIEDLIERADGLESFIFFIVCNNQIIL